jgi:nitrate reductase gamma subunit
LPIIYLSGLALLGTASFLFLRRVLLPKIKYISLATDYFPLLLILFIAFTGILMRYFTKVDIVSIKELIIGITTFSFNASVFKGIDTLFFVHIFLVSILFAYFPFSQLMHGIGIFFSPTRNMANNNRKKRHINPWNYPVKLHTYEQYEDDFRETMKKAGLPVEKE